MSISKAAYTVRLSTRGRITIPIGLRRRLGIRGGETVKWRDVPVGVELVIDDSVHD